MLVRKQEKKIISIALIFSEDDYAELLTVLGAKNQEAPAVKK